MNRAHAYKSASAENKTDEDKGINMGLFSYPILMATDILIKKLIKVLMEIPKLFTLAH